MDGCSKHSGAGEYYFNAPTATGRAGGGPCHTSGSPGAADGSCGHVAVCRQTTGGVPPDLCPPRPLTAARARVAGAYTLKEFRIEFRWFVFVMPFAAGC